MARIIADGVEYEVEAFTLGEFRILKRDFGLEDVGGLDLGNPDHLVGALYVLGRRKDPDLTVEAVESVTTVEFVQDEPGEDPTPASSGEEATAEATGDGEGGS